MRKLNVILLVIGCVLLSAGYIVGCGGGDWPIRWRPTEAQKQAGDLTVQDITDLKDFTEPAGEPLRKEALRSAEATRNYLSAPKVRPVPVAPDNDALLEKVEQNAAKPLPTPTQVAAVVTNKAQDAVDTGAGLLSQILTILGTAAGTLGLTGAASRIIAGKTKIAELKAAADSGLTALTEVVRGIDAAKPVLPPDAVNALKAALGDAMSTETKNTVYLLR